MEPLSFEDYTPDLCFETLRRTLTDYDVGSFVGLTGMYGPMFMDLEHVTEIYGGRLVPGTLVLAISDGLILGTGTLHGRGLALLGMTVEYPNPVFVGDTVRVRVTVEEARLTSRGDRGVVVTAHTVLNQHDVEVVRCTVKRLVKGRSYGTGG